MKWICWIIPGFVTLPVLPDDEQQALALCFLQARRPFLLQRAAVQQEVTHLLVCSASAHRNETRHVGHLLDFWVKQTQGETSVQRSGRKPGLISAMTPYDQRITHGRTTMRRCSAMWATRGCLGRDAGDG